MVVRAALCSILVLAGLTNPRAAAWPDWADSASKADYEQRHTGRGAVVLLDEWNVKLQADGARTSVRRLLLHVLDESGLGDAGLALTSDVYDAYTDVKIWLRWPDGTTVRYSDKEATRVGSADMSILSEAETLWIEPPGLTPGSFLAVEASHVSPGAPYQDFFELQRDLPVLEASVSLEMRGGWQAVARVHPGDNPGPSRVDNRARWVFRDLPALVAPDDPSTPVPPVKLFILDYAPAGGEVEFGDWNAVARWGAKLFGPVPAATSPRLERSASGIFSKDADPVESAGRMARSLRYFAILLGHGGYVPREPEVTLAQGFGDCKGKAYLMIELLRRAGVEAYPVLVIAPSDGFVPDGLPSPFHFDHAVVAIPWPRSDSPSPGQAVVEAPGLGPVRIFDATLAENSPQDIGPWLEGGTGLVLHAATTGLLRLPGSDHTENRWDAENDWQLGVDGMLRARRVDRVRGAYRLDLTDDDDQWLGSGQLRREAYAVLSVDQPGFRNLRVGELREEQPGVWSFDSGFDNPTALSRFGEIDMLRLGELEDPNALALPAGDGPEELVQTMPGVIRETHEIHLFGRSPIGVPEPFEVVTDLGWVRVEVRRETESVWISRELALTRFELTGEDREDALRLRRALGRANAIVVLFPAD